MSPKPFYSTLLLLLAFSLHSQKNFAQVSYENAFPKVSFNFPVELLGSEDGSNRMFVVEQPGKIKVFPNDFGVTNDEIAIFLDISNIVSYSSGQEIGLLGMAFHPQYADNGYVFIYYIDQPSNYRINIARYQVSPTDANKLNPDSATIIAQFSKNQADSNHNGGKIAFGPDGYLYASIGDGGGAGDPQGNGQNLESIFGSLIRIDVDLNGDNPLENNPLEPNGLYEIPSDNPRVGTTGLDELYAWGLRNTWKFSFDGEGRIWGADVGQNGYEEVNLIEKGGNYGWNRFEANEQPSYGANTVLATNPDIKPIHIYDHSAGDVSITGGLVYRGNMGDPRLRNRYIYGDFVSGRVWSLGYDLDSGSLNNELLFKANGVYISTFGEDENGEIYFSDYANAANIYKLTEDVTQPEPTPVEGVGAWQSLGDGINGIVECVIQDLNGNTIVGGNFTSAGNIPASNLAIIDADGNWDAISPGPNGTIFDMALSNEGALFVAGDFSEIDGIKANNIAYYDGSQWNPLGNGTNGPVAKIQFDTSGNILYAGGVFSEANDLTVNNIAKWENGDWQPLMDINTDMTGTNNEIRAMAIDSNDHLYIGGNFDAAGGINANRIAEWDGSTWQPLGDGTSGFVQAIIVQDNFIYAGGNFVSAGDKTVNRIARFDTVSRSWESLGNGLSGNVNALITNNSFIYTTGTFETASNLDNLDLFMGNVARWSENSGWQALGTGTDVGINIRGNALVYNSFKDELVVGGNFDKSGKTINTNNISKWSPSISSVLVDTDADGVDDANDTCPDTPANTPVNSNGCAIPPFPFDQFAISSQGTTCLGNVDGQINIISKSDGDFVASLSGDGITDTQSFTSALSLDNLAPGSYNLCLSASNGEYQEQCSQLIIKEPVPLEVTTAIDFDNKTITLKVRGSSNFTVQLNDKRIVSSTSEVTLPLDRETNKLTVVSNDECLGSYTETIVISDTVRAFPNPFHDQLYVDLPKQLPNKIEVIVYKISGEKVLSKTFDEPTANISLQTDQFIGGMYIVQLRMGSVNRYLKVFKS